MQSTTEGNITYYFYGNGLTAQDDGTDYLTYHFNNVGSTMAVADDKGNKIVSYEYSPYGQIISRKQEKEGLIIPFLYNGQYGVTTDDSGLYYMRARYYNVDIRRFLNQDVLTGTLERISSLNRYAYVEVTYFMQKRGVLILMGIAMLFLSGCTIDWEKVLSLLLTKKQSGW